MTDLAEVAALVAQILSRHRFDLSDEKVTQGQIAEALLAGGIEHRREVRLSQHDRPDFLLSDSGLAIEVKLRAGRMDIWRQLVRYAAHEAVRGLMLVSNTAMTLPAETAGKPLFLVSLGRSWL